MQMITETSEDDAAAGVEAEQAVPAPIRTSRRAASGAQKAQKAQKAHKPAPKPRAKARAANTADPETMTSAAAQSVAAAPSPAEAAAAASSSAAAAASSSEMHAHSTGTPADKPKHKKKKKHKDGDVAEVHAKSAPAAARNGNGHHGKASFTLDDLHKGQRTKLSKKSYESELKKLFLELIKLQEWVVDTKARVVVLFEGRDTAGKGGVIKRISEPLNPRVCRVAALGTPSSREKTQWYFQRYVEHLPAGGEIVLFDRSWYNRAGVEHVMGFCTDDEYKEFLRSCPEFEYLLVRSGIILLKYWLSVSDDVQEERFRERADNPLKRWKLSPMDLKSRDKWVEYSKAKDAMFMHTDTRHAPWFVVNSDVKERARLNLITHLLSRIPYQSTKVPKIKLGKRKKAPTDYVRPPLNTQNIVPEYF